MKIVELAKIYTEIKAKRFGSVIYSMTFMEGNLRSLTTLIVINSVTNKIYRPIINIFNVYHLTEKWRAIFLFLCWAKKVLFSLGVWESGDPNSEYALGSFVKRLSKYWFESLSLTTRTRTLTTTTTTLTATIARKTCAHKFHFSFARLLTKTSYHYVELFGFLLLCTVIMYFPFSRIVHRQICHSRHFASLFSWACSLASRSQNHTDMDALSRIIRFQFYAHVYVCTLKPALAHTTNRKKE